MVKALMTWNSKQNRWFKKYEGKQYSVGCKALKSEPTKQASIAAANAWWKSKQIELDQAQKNPDYDPVLAAICNFGSSFISDAKPYGKTTTLGGMVERKIDRKRTLAESQAINPKTYDLYRRCLERFLTFAGKSRPFEGENYSTLLLDFHAHLLKEVEAGTIQPGYAEDHIRAVKDFLHDCAVEGLIPLPIILAGGRKNSNKLKIKNMGNRRITKAAKRKANKNKTWLDDMDGLKRLIHTAPPKVKLAVLLALNCGYLNTDISELSQEEIDYENGTITRERSKTAGKEHTPEVIYKLWPDTLDLLKKYRAGSDAPKNRNGETVALTNKHGEKLVQVEIKPDGKLKENDAVKSSYRSFARKKGIKKPLQVCRHTTATMIRDDENFDLPLARYFLGQAPDTVAEKNYIAANPENLAKALAAVADKIGLKHK